MMLFRLIMQPAVSPGLRGCLPVCVSVCVCVCVCVLQSLWEDTETRQIQFSYLVSKLNLLINFQVIVG